MRRRGSRKFGTAIRSLTISACAVLAVGASSAGESKPWPHPTYYTVIARPGETLAGLAARFGVPAADVARLNHLNSRDPLATGEVLRIPAASSATRQAVLDEALDRSAPNYAPPPKNFGAAGYTGEHQIVASRETAMPSGSWVKRDNIGAVSGRFGWPVQGPVISAFGPAANGERNDGINIATMLGTPIRAAAAGTVTYAGDELKGYGNLILIAHPGGYITAYAHAESIAVARGDHVEKGQAIGTAGETGGVDRPQLHFEIREGVKPINPVRLLAALP